MILHRLDSGNDRVPSLVDGRGHDILLSHLEGFRNEQSMQSFEIAHFVSIKFEAKIFRIYDSVNKKYKEKERSLLFKVKDRNNPELRDS